MLPVRVDTDGIGRYPQDVEAALYFCTLEALPEHLEIRAGVLNQRAPSGAGRAITFEVVDDGVGFDPPSALRDRARSRGTCGSDPRADLDRIARPRLT